MKPALKDKVEALLRCADDLKSSIAENPNDDNELESLVEKMATCLEDPSHVSPHRCNDKPYLDASTCAHAGIQRDISNAPLAPLLSFATTFEKTGVEGQFVYSRHENPTRKFLEQEIAKLESGCANSCCCAFSSGMMAASAIVLAHGLPLTVYLPEDCYHGVPTVIKDVFSRFNVETQTVSLSSPDKFSKELKIMRDEEKLSSSALFWFESPSNPKCNVLDVPILCEIIRENAPDASVVLDSTLAPPVLWKPLMLGPDLVMHSATKYIGGHSDVLMGVVTANPNTAKGIELVPRLRQVQACVGGVASPMDCWLALRGIRTLDVRVKRQCESAMKLATFLTSQPDTIVAKVNHPGLEEHPHHGIASRLFAEGCGGTFSVDFVSADVALRWTRGLSLAVSATSLGGTETLVEHRASIEPSGRVTSPPGLVRISVGLEAADDLIEDFDRALQQLKN